MMQVQVKRSTITTQKLHKGVIKGEVVDYLVGAVSFGGTCAAPDSAAIYSGRFENLAEKAFY